MPSYLLTEGASFACIAFSTRRGRCGICHARWSVRIYGELGFVWWDEGLLSWVTYLRMQPEAGFHACRLQSVIWPYHSRVSSYALARITFERVGQGVSYVNFSTIQSWTHFFNLRPQLEPEKLFTPKWSSRMSRTVHRYKK